MKKAIMLCTLLAVTGCAGLVPRSDRVSEKAGENGWVSYSKGLFFLNLKDYKSALPFFEAALKEKKETDTVYYHMAVCHYNLYDYEAAKNFSELAIRENPDFNKPYFLLYSMYMNLRSYDKAARVLENLVPREKDSAHLRFTLGTLYYSRLKKWDEAENYFSSILELAAAMAVDDYYQEHSFYYLGHIYYARGMHNRSIDYFKSCLEINPDNHSAVYALAVLYMEQYRLNESLEYTSRYLENYPDNIKMLLAAGRIHYLNNDRQAQTYLKRAMYASGFDGKFARALYLETLRKDREAESLLKDIIKQNTAYISPHLGLAGISLRNGNASGAVSEYFTAGILFYRYRQYDNARSCLLKALAINDTVPEFYFYLAKTHEETGRYSQALANYKKVLELKPSAEIHIHIGYLYSLRNNYTEATRYLDSAIEMDPGNSKSYFFKGIIYTQMDRYSDAEKLIRQAISLNEENDEYHFYLATVLEKLNRIDDTINSLKKAIKYNPESAKSYNFLGYLYADNNINIEESIALINKALQFEPDNGAYLDSLGWAYFRKKDFNAALKKLLTAEILLNKENSPDPVVYDHIGDTYRELGNIKKAVEYWNKSLRIKKDSKIEKKIQDPN